MKSVQKQKEYKDKAIMHKIIRINRTEDVLINRKHKIQGGDIDNKERKKEYPQGQNEYIGELFQNER